MPCAEWSIVASNEADGEHVVRARVCANVCVCVREPRSYLGEHDAARLHDELDACGGVLERLHLHDVVTGQVLERGQGGVQRGQRLVQ
eukprot:2413118-Pyramimonas_sp.AAC.1